VNLPLFILLLILAFFLLSKTAGYFVRSAVNLAELFQVSKIFIGIVLVAFATTAPEFAVSVQSAYLGHPEIALGNAVGSVICDDALAMALAAIVSISPLAIDKRYLIIVGPFLLSIDLLAYLLAWDGTFSKGEGMILVVILFLYVLTIFAIESKRRKGAVPPAEHRCNTPKASHAVGREVVIFILALAGVILSSRLVIWSSINIASIFGIPETIIGLSVIAIGTSLPEISTCVAAAIKQEGDIIVGDILGADILNILWIVGVSAFVDRIEVEKRVIHFAFPWMIFIVGAMLVSMRMKHEIGRPKGFILLGLYVIYIYTTIRFFY